MLPNRTERIKAQDALVTLPARPATGLPAGWRRVVTAAWDIRRARGMHPMIKLLLYTLASRGEDCRPSLATIAGDMGISRAAAKRWVRAAAEAKLIEVETRCSEAGDPDSNRYALILQTEGGGVSSDPTGGVTADPRGGVSSDPLSRKRKGKGEVKRSTTSTKSSRGRSKRDPMPGEEPMPGLLAAVKTEPPPEVKPPSPAQLIVAAFAEARSPRTITGTDRGMVGRDAKALLAAGADPGELAECAADLGAGDFANLRTEWAIRQRRGVPIAQAEEVSARDWTEVVYRS
jgi:hypothetical protein